VDGVWAYIGTGNFDALSLRHNYEFGLSLGPGAAIEELEIVYFCRTSSPTGS